MSLLVKQSAKVFARSPALIIDAGKTCRVTAINHADLRFFVCFVCLFFVCFFFAAQDACILLMRTRNDRRLGGPRKQNVHGKQGVGGV